MNWTKGVKPTGQNTGTWVSGVKPTSPRNGHMEIGFQRELQLEDLKFDALLELGSRNLPGQPHYFGQWVVQFYAYWKRYVASTSPISDDPRDGLVDPFYQWLEGELKKEPLSPDIESILHATTDGNKNLQVKDFDKTKRDLTARQRFLAGVKYISKEADRKKYEIKLKAGLMYRGVDKQGQKLLFDTSKLSTVARGTGWAIWVQGPDSRFYSHSHKVARFHHSSFLAGGAVLSAGEWKVINGRIHRINAKSGHYRPSMQGFHAAVRYLKSLCVCGQDCQVMLYERNGRGVYLVTVRRFLQDSWRTWLTNYMTDANSTELPVEMGAYGNRTPAAQFPAMAIPPASPQIGHGPSGIQNSYQNSYQNAYQNSYQNSYQNAYQNQGSNSSQNVYHTGGDNRAATSVNDPEIIYFNNEVVAYQN